MGPTWGGGGPAARPTSHVPRGPTHGEDGPRKRELAKPPYRESAVLDPSGHGANRIRSRNGLRRALRPAGHSRLGHQQADATLYPLPAGLLLVPRQREAEPAPQAAVPRAPSAAMARALPAPHTRLHPQGRDTPRDTSGRREKAPV